MCTVRITDGLGAEFPDVERRYRNRPGPLDTEISSGSKGINSSPGEY
jgi:hypothetical protein